MFALYPASYHAVFAVKSVNESQRMDELCSSFDRSLPSEPYKSVP